MYLLAGITTFAVSLLASAAAAYFPARWVARRIGIPGFRIFDVIPLGRFVERAAVRLVSVMGPLLLAFIMATSAVLVRGELVATNQVEVLPGPAMAAGIRNGDRIVSMDGVPTPGFEDIRHQVKNGRPSHDLVVERDGNRRTVTVVPDENGAIKVAAMTHRRSIGLGTAMKEAARLINGFAAALSPSGSARVELAGPVAIVKSVGTSQPADRLAAPLWMACYAACSVALLVVALHLFDGLTYGWFLVSSKRKGMALLSGTLVRRRHALGLALLLGIVGLGAFTALEIADIRLGTSVEVLLKSLLALAIPLAWLLARELYGLRRALALAVLFFVPLLNVVVPLGLWFLAGRALRRERVETGSSS